MKNLERLAQNEALKLLSIPGYKCHIKFKSVEDSTWFFNRLTQLVPWQK